MSTRVHVMKFRKGTANFSGEWGRISGYLVAENHTKEENHNVLRRMILPI